MRHKCLNSNRDSLRFYLLTWADRHWSLLRCKTLVYRWWQTHKWSVNLVTANQKRNVFVGFLFVLGVFCKWAYKRHENKEQQSLEHILCLGVYNTNIYRCYSDVWPSWSRIPLTVLAILFPTTGTTRCRLSKLSVYSSSQEKKKWRWGVFLHRFVKIQGWSFKLSMDEEHEVSGWKCFSSLSHLLVQRCV